MVKLCETVTEGDLDESFYSGFRVDGAGAPQDVF